MLIRCRARLASAGLLVGVMVGVMATLALGGCGLKGPLYRPGEPVENDASQPNSSPVARKKSPFERIPAPQAQKNGQKTDAQKSDPQKSDQSGETSTNPSPPIDPDRPASIPPTP